MKGKSERNCLTMDMFLKNISRDVIDYCDTYCESGIYLPKEYEKDPSSWTQILRQIQEAFELIETNDPENLNEEERKRYENGIELFFKYIKHLFR